MKATIFTFALVIGAVCLLPISASATENEANISAGKERASLGFPGDAVVFRDSGFLDRGRRTLVPVRLRRGDNTIVIAGCDDGFELNVSILDDDRNPLTQPRGGHAFSIQFDAPDDGLYHIAIEMERADETGAHWAVQVCR